MKMISQNFFEMYLIFFNAFPYIGTWPPNHRFDIPRSVLSMPDSRIENGSGHDRDVIANFPFPPMAS